MAELSVALDNRLPASIYRRLQTMRSSEDYRAPLEPLTAENMSASGRWFAVASKILDAHA